MPLDATKLVAIQHLTYDSIADADKVDTFVMCGVSYHGAAAVRTGGGLNENSGFKLRIFAQDSRYSGQSGLVSAGESYIPPDEYSAAQAESGWTVAIGDKIVLGALSTAQEGTVVGIHDNRGSRVNPHWLLEVR